MPNIAFYFTVFGWKREDPNELAEFIVINSDSLKKAKQELLQYGLDPNNENLIKFSFIGRKRFGGGHVGLSTKDGRRIRKENKEKDKELQKTNRRSQYFTS